MNIRKALPADLDEIMNIYAEAREFMVQTGNPHQWAERCWPPKWLIGQDIEAGKCYVCQDGESLTAVFYYAYGENVDPCYAVIEGGSWCKDGPYGVVHRIAARKGRGAGRRCIQWAYEQCGHLRIDTHEDNKVMQKVLKQLGFVYCGIIYIEDNHAPRMAFEKYKK